MLARQHGITITYNQWVSQAVTTPVLAQQSMTVSQKQADYKSVTRCQSVPLKTLPVPAPLNADVASPAVLKAAAA